MLTNGDFKQKMLTNGDFKRFIRSPTKMIPIVIATLFLASLVISFASDLLFYQLYNEENSISSKFVVNHYSPRKLTPEMIDNAPFNITLMNQNVVKIEEYIKKLDVITHRHQTKLILPIFFTSEYIPVLLNWLSHVFLKLRRYDVMNHLMLVALDNGSCAFIHTFTPTYFSYICIIDYEDLMKATSSNNDNDAKVSFLFSFRLFCFWLWSHWGYDILHFDVDAVPVHNKFVELFTDQDAELVGGTGKFPHVVYKMFKRTLCMGSIYFRSSVRESQSKILNLFKLMKTFNSNDDQMKLNLALTQLKLSFEGSSMAKNQKLDPFYYKMIGASKLSQLRVVFLPQTQVCRSSCEYIVTNPNNYELHIMHPYFMDMTAKKGRTKIAIIQKFKGLWVLKDNFNWKKQNNSQLILNYLKSITNFN